jgi:hypothetical protein
MKHLHEALSRTWPGEPCVVQGGELVRWDGPTPRPSDAEIEQAVGEYNAISEVVHIAESASESAHVATMLAFVLRERDAAAWDAQTDEEMRTAIQDAKKTYRSLWRLIV